VEFAQKKLDSLPKGVPRNCWDELDALTWESDDETYLYLTKMRTLLEQIDLEISFKYGYPLHGYTWSREGLMNLTN